jgi:Spy/CpxP family protein refolding chaperone
MRHGEWGNVGEGKMHENAPYWRHLNDLALNEKQKAEVKEIRNRVMKETIRKMADERIAGIELKELLDKDPVDMKTVETKLRQIESLRTDIRLSHIKALEEVKAKLTPEQKKKFKELCDMEPPMGGRVKKGGMMHGSQRMPPPPGAEEEERR